MRAFVFTDTTLGRHAGRFVWLEMDTENAGNAGFREQYEPRALPTYYIVDPAGETVALRWVGGMTLAQMEHLLDEGERIVAGGGAAPSPADEALRAADGHYGRGDYAAAIGPYREALAAAPDGWPAYARSVESLLFALSSVDSAHACAALARDAAPRVRGTASAVSIAGSGLGGSLGMPAGHPERAALIALHEAGLRAALADPSVRISADDRSSYLAMLMEVRSDAGDSTGARKAAGEWAAFLDAEAARAATPEERTVFDSHRLSAYLELGRAGDAVAFLKDSERSLPDDYNPPARLAVAYSALERWDDALAACDRALGKVHGPRRIRVLLTKSDALAGKGDVAAARATLEEAIAFAEALPAGQRSESTIASLRKKLEGMAGTGG